MQRKKKSHLFTQPKYRHFAHLLTTSQNAIKEIKSIAPQAVKKINPAQILWGDRSLRPMKLFDKMAAYLETESKKSVVTQLPPEPRVSPYHSVVIPQKSITSYFRRLWDYWFLNEGTFIAALILINRVRHDPPFDSFTAHRLLLASLEVARLQTDYDKDEITDDVAGLSKSELGKLRVDFINHPMISFSGIRFDEYQTMLSILLQDELNYDAFQSTKTILNRYLINDLCTLVSEYLPRPSSEAPSPQLIPYLSFCRFFPGKIPDENKMNVSDDSKKKISESKGRKRKLEKSDEGGEPKKRKVRK